MNIEILDCTPAMADIVSGAIPRPRERLHGENPVEWLIESTPAWQRIASRFDLLDADFSIEDRPEMQPPASLGLTDFPNIYALIWHEPPRLRAAILLVNPDGTRCSILDIWGEIERLWGNVRRPNAGRPRIETENKKTLAQRKWRDKEKQST